ncbi:MAG: stage III sporulation protein AG [Oscillospiraceae bacterium]|nr:stage III sporulation protein AG [Oscillospiraceae bacterium]
MALEQKLKERALAGKQLAAGLKKYRYPLLIAVVGLGLLLIPSGEQKAVSAPADPVVVQSMPDADMERRLESILQCISGAGQVRVMLTVKHEGVTTYQSDSEVTKSSDTTNTRTQTVFRTDGSYQQSPLITKVSAPEYLGALVVCGGGDDPGVRLKVVRAVCALTGLGSDQVTVLKMDGL